MGVGFCFVIFIHFFLFILKIDADLKYVFEKKIYVWDVPHSESQFLKVILHLLLL